MKIKTIGTGAITATERSACTLIDEKILIDCGNGTIKTLLEQNIDISKIEVLLITHLHGDHFLDIPFMILQRRFNKVEKDLNIYCPIGTEKTVKNIINLTYADTKDWTQWRDVAKVKFIEFEHLKNKEVTKEYFVDSYIVNHGELKPAYGYIIVNQNTSLGISGDSAYCDSIDEIVKNSTVSILDMSFIDKNDKHMNFNDIEKIINKFNKTVIVTHMSEEVRKYAKDKNIDKLIIPKDGEEFEI